MNISLKRQIQSNLFTTTTLSTHKKWSMEVFQSKLVLKLVWPSLKGGRFSEVAVYTGLTVRVKTI
jgi:hypothetical protein